jgi:hypothetical protein
MELRSLQITMYVGALALIAACGSSTPNSSPFENATNNLKPDASQNLAPAPAPTSSSNGTDNKAAPASCKSDNDCGNGCPNLTSGSSCCCDQNTLTCYMPASGSCPSSNNGGGDDGGGSSSGGGDDGGGSSSGDDSGGGMQMMP